MHLSGILLKINVQLNRTVHIRLVVAYIPTSPSADLTASSQSARDAVLPARTGRVPRRATRRDPQSSKYLATRIVTWNSPRHTPASAQANRQNFQSLRTPGYKIIRQ